MMSMRWARWIENSNPPFCIREETLCHLEGETASGLAPVGGIQARKPQPGLLHDTDRGGQYLSAEYQDELDHHGMICSMSRPGRCQDHVVAESFFHRLKAEWIYHFDFATREQARLAIFDYVEGFYNLARMRSTLNYRSPDEYEKMNTVA